MVSYALGNKNDAENDVKVIGEDGDKVITYSKALPIILTKYCKNSCGYCGFKKSENNLTVPYSIIKATKQARQNGARESFFVAGERPDRSTFIRSTLDLWGFNSYLDYLYTICELAFLEGLIPVIDLGFLAPPEMEKMAEISAIFKMMLDGVDASVEENLYKNSLSKKYEIRLKSLDWAGKLNIPIATGFTIGIGESMDFRRRMLEDIANIHRTYANVHEVVLQPFSPDPKVVFSGKVPSRDLMLQLVGIAKNILPADINVIVPYSFIANDLADFLNAGINDLGRIPDQYNPIPSQLKPVDFKELEQKVTDLGYTLQQRFPLRLPYIKEARYSKKLGQVFDAYRYKIKKEEQEKQKDLKINPK